MTVLNQVPDSLKVSAATSPTVLIMWGIPIEQWMFVASAVVSIMFVIEKAPVCIKNIRTFINWIKSVKRKKLEKSTGCERKASEDCTQSK